MSDEQDDAVGYGRPPRKTQFGQPGGNRRGPGRKRGSRNVSTVFAEVASSKVIAKDGKGKRRSISKFEAALTQLINQAASGDLRAIRMMITLAEGIEAKSDQANPPEITLTEADRKAIALLTQRVAARFEGQEDD